MEPKVNCDCARNALIASPAMRRSCPLQQVDVGSQYDFTPTTKLRRLTLSYNNVSLAKSSLYAECTALQLQMR